ncbi:amidase family protein [Amycolatopsis sp. NPDC003731]
MPFAIKDSFDTAGVRTTRGSSLFADHVPEADATAAARLRAAGGIPLAKTNLPEMSYWTEPVVRGRVVVRVQDRSIGDREEADSAKNLVAPPEQVPATRSAAPAGV